MGEELKENLQKYLDSKICGAGKYGLTIHEDGFMDDLIKTIQLSLNGEKLKINKPKKNKIPKMTFGGRQ
jgi:hypothetical protein